MGAWGWGPLPFPGVWMWFPELTAGLDQFWGYGENCELGLFEYCCGGMLLFGGGGCEAGGYGWFGYWMLPGGLTGYTPCPYCWFGW